MPVNAFYEQAYYTRTGIDDVDGIFERWQQDSEVARNTLTGHLDLRYGDAHREAIDLFIATEDTTRWLVFIHGGYWRVTTKEYYSFLAAPFVQAGWNVAIPEYDVCPAVSMHTIIEQCQRAIAWLVQNAAQYSPGCDAITLSGHSAGGHLTGMMFATDWHSYGVDKRLFQGGIALSGLFDLDPIAHTAMNSDLKLTQDDVLQLSPARLSAQIDAPLVLTAGSRESSEFARQNHLLHGAPIWDAITSELILLDNIHHFDILDVFMDTDSVLWQKLREMQETA